MALSGATLELYSTREVSYLGRFVSWTATVQKPTYTHTYYLVAGTLLILAQTPVDPRRRLALPRRFSNMTSFEHSPPPPKPPYRNGELVCVVLFFLRFAQVPSPALLLILAQHRPPRPPPARLCLTVLRPSLLCKQIAISSVTNDRAYSPRARQIVTTVAQVFVLFTLSALQTFR